MNDKPETNEAGRTCGLAVAPCSAGRLFNPRLLDRCLISKEAAAIFRDEAMRCVRRDELTGLEVVAYLHPDGRVLIDSIGKPNPKSSRGTAQP